MTGWPDSRGPRPGRSVASDAVPAGGSAQTMVAASATITATGATYVALLIASLLGPRRAHRRRCYGILREPRLGLPGSSHRTRWCSAARSTKVASDAGLGVVPSDAAALAPRVE